MFGGVEDGSVVWKRIAEIDHGLLGYFLTCHLVIEHYMDEYLKATMTQLTCCATFASHLTFQHRRQYPNS